MRNCGLNILYESIDSSPLQTCPDKKGVPVISFDIDPAAVEKNYLSCRENKNTNLLPLLLDLTNPSPGIGWANRERLMLGNRKKADTVLALALIHHLAITNNVPLEAIAAFFASLCKWLIIEFIPKQDSMVRRLLASRSDVFDEYTEEGFKQSFTKYFAILKARQLPESARTIYLMKII